MSDVQVHTEYDLGADFEPVVLSCILFEDRFYERYQKLLAPEIFFGPSGAILRFVEEYHIKNRKVASVATLTDLIRRSGDKDAGTLVSFLSDLQPCADVEYAASRVRDWAKWRAMDQILTDDDARSDPREFAKRLDQASRIGDDLFLEHTRLDQDEDDETFRNEIVPTPFEWLNGVMNGGPEKGDLAVVITVINGGKTTLLVNVAMHSVALGLHVVYVTFEDGEAKIKRRMMQWINGWTTEQLMSNIARARKRRDLFLQDSGGKLHVKKFHSRRSSVSDLISFVKSVEEAEDRKVDVVIADYGDRFKPEGRYNEPRHGLREVYEDLKYASGEMNVVLWTASQGNKLKIGKDIIGIEDGSESTGKFESCDFAFGFGQTMEDQKRGTATWFNSKMRDSEKGGMTTLLADFEVQRIYERGNERMSRKETR